MVDANESSKSEDRNSSTSSLGRWKRWLFLREGAGGAARNCVVVEVDDGAKNCISSKSKLNFG